MRASTGDPRTEDHGRDARADARPASEPARSRRRRAGASLLALGIALALAVTLGGMLAGCAADAVAGVPTARSAQTVAGGEARALQTEAPDPGPILPTASPTTIPTATPAATATPPASATSIVVPTTAASATSTTTSTVASTDTSTVTSTVTSNVTSTVTSTVAPTPRPPATSTPIAARTASATPSSRPTATIPTPAIGSPAATTGAAPATADVGLDPGHHRLDVGAAGGGLREYEVTLDLAQRAKRHLEAAGLRVALSRTDNEPVATARSGDATEQIRLEQEARIRAVGNARVFVSVHLNAFGDPSLGGTETYYNPDTVGGEGRRLATALQSGVLRRLAEVGYTSSNRGAKSDLSAGKPYGHFFSLRGPLPSALVEALFLSNPAEAALLGRDDVREGIARGIADGVAAYLGR